MDTRAQRPIRPQPIKRRACEECRTRKLGCTKEPNGCSRCIRDGVRCHYSTQKPMGRPRKRRQSQVHAEERQENQPVINSAVDPASDSAHANPNPVDLDLDMAFFDMNDMSFFDLLIPNASQGHMNHVPTAPEPPKQPTVDPTPFMTGTHLLGDINFDAPLPSQPQPLTEEFTPSQLSSLITTEITSAFPATTPPLTNPSSSTTSLPALSPPSTTSSKTPSPPPTPLPPCGCISSLYLALDSLQRLPRTVSTAMKVARTVAKTCHNTILCPSCANPPISIHDGHYDPPIASFQSMMMLGAILPSLSNAYKQILEMVDAETAAADGKITFELASYGGLWGMLGASDNVCGAADKVDGAVLDPGMWRLTVRALLKIDVYGIDGSTAGWGGAICEGFKQPGLKNIIAMMEERARLRHETLDGMMARGEVNDHTRCGQYYSLCSASKPTCLRIIDIAKQSMRTLDIP